LKEQAANLEASNKKAEESVQALAAVMSEKNTVERMLEEMEKKKELAELEKEKFRDENNQLLDTVTVLTDARASDHAAHAITVRKWRNELVAYQEKTPTEFLAEILTLVSDMDNEVEIEIADATLAASRLGGGVREAKAEELSVCEEWSHNPRLAMAAPDRLCRLASRSREPTALGDGPAQVLTTNTENRGTSGAEIKMTTPTQAAKRRAALGNLPVNTTPVTKAKTPVAQKPALTNAVDKKQLLLQEMAAARFEMEQLKSESAAVGLLDAPISPAMNSSLGSRHRASSTQKASLNLSFFGARSASKKAPTAVRQSRAAAAVAGVAKRQQMAAAVFDDFGSDNMAPSSRAVMLSPR
tara:strand:+ start:250 stop:1317 length:1068 start_codon:yes stop_codon:yes gene_type:complete